MRPTEEQDVALKILHTADWHLGRGFPSFMEVDQPKLTQARIEAVDKLLGLAESYAVNAVLCAGDLFHEPTPADTWWRELLAVIRTPKVERASRISAPWQSRSAVADVGLGRTIIHSGAACRIGFTWWIARITNLRYRRKRSFMPCPAGAKPAPTIQPRTFQCEDRATSGFASAWCTARLSISLDMK
jgi:hypothetical protein